MTIKKTKKKSLKFYLNLKLSSSTGFPKKNGEFQAIW